MNPPSESVGNAAYPLIPDVSRSREALAPHDGCRNTDRVDEEIQPPICIRCGVTMVPVELSAGDLRDGDWVCVECEELGQHE
jgi:hypothetical protein